MENHNIAKLFQFVAVLLTILATGAPGEVKSGILSEFVDSAAGLPARTKPTRTIKLGGDLSFGGVPVLRKKTRQLKITNTSNSTLNVKGIVFSKGSACSGSWQGVVLPGKSHTVPITFNPQVIKNYAGVLTVKSDKNGGNNTLQLSGTGISATPDYLFREEYSSAETGGLSGSSYLTSDGIGVFELNWESSPDITQYQIVSNKTAGKPESVDSTMNMIFDARSPLNAHGLPTAVFLEDGYYISFGELDSSTGALTATLFQSSLDGGEGTTNGSFTVILPPASVARRTGLTGKSPLRPNPPDSGSVVSFAASNVLGFTQLALKSAAGGLTNKDVVEFALDKTMNSISLANDSGAKNQVIDLITTGISASSCVTGSFEVAALLALAPATAGTSLLPAGVMVASTAISCSDVLDKIVSSAIDAHFLYDEQYVAIGGLKVEFKKVDAVFDAEPINFLKIGLLYSTDPLNYPPILDIRPNPQYNDWLTKSYWATSRYASVVEHANSGGLTEKEKILVTEALVQLAYFKEIYNLRLSEQIFGCTKSIESYNHWQTISYNVADPLASEIAAKNRYGYHPRF